MGADFLDFYGHAVFRTDLSVSVGALGSLLEHTGVIGEAERNAARVFGADRTYFVLNGTSTADRIVGHYSALPGDRVLVDRNCHKAVLHALVLSGARPTYLVPSRNGYGIIGPVPPSRLLPPDGPLDGPSGGDVALAVVTNSTYDGLCYDAVRVADLLSKSAPRVHFDEAWFGYARFHPLYDGRYGMAVTGRSLPGPERPTVFATQSTHKMLAALSQGAMLHVRSAPRAPVRTRALDETYMMHASTSPSYPMLASLDVATAMVDQPGPSPVIEEALAEAIAFRQAVAHTAKAVRHTAPSGEENWFFGVWQPEDVTDPDTGETFLFEEAPVRLLLSDPRCWYLTADQDWHGFPGLPDGYCMLDPLKVTLTCPGVDAWGNRAECGVPARVLSAYLETRGIVVEKTGGHTVLVLFSPGSTREKWVALLEALADFKALYDGGAPLGQVLPGIVAAHPRQYDGLTLRGLCDRMHGFLDACDHADLLAQAFMALPEAALTPAETYRKLLRDGAEPVPLVRAAGRVAATTVAVTPPGIPVLMPGERLGGAEGPLLRHLTGLQEFDKEFPGFPTEIHGLRREAATGDYVLDCLRHRRDGSSREEEATGEAEGEAEGEAAGEASAPYPVQTS
ncbi:Orn/Lys/Arg decarboxylase N-terminal domain-containing protein [Streptomyces daliensis]